jgi:hypothetical protein
MGKGNLAKRADAMSAAPVKKVELTRQQRFENMLFSLAAPGAMLAALWWYLNLCWHQAAKHKRDKKPGIYLPKKPVTISLFGANPTEATDILKGYNITFSFGLVRWVVVDNRVGLQFLFLVSSAQFDYADAILAQFEGEAFEIHSTAGNKRGQNFGAPFAARQPTKTVKRPAPKQAKLGRTYKDARQ